MKAHPIRTAMLAGLAVVTVGGALAACDASSKSSTAAGARSVELSPTAAPSSAAPAGGFSPPSSGFAYPADASAAASAAAPAPSVPSSPQAGPVPAPGGGPAQVPILQNRDVIMTASVTLQVTSVPRADSAIDEIARNNQGVVSQRQASLAPTDPGQSASATVTILVPPANLAATLDDLSGLGKEVSLDEGSQDVTGTVVDVNSRISAAQTSIARLQALMDKAGSVGDLLAVENQIAQRQSDLESLEQQQKTLQAQTSYATVTVHLTPPPVPVQKAPTKPKQAHVVGFVRGLRGGWHAFTRTVSAIGAALGAMLPFLVLVVVLGGALLVGRRTRRRRTAIGTAGKTDAPA
jgi:hypothetical protein